MSQWTGAPEVNARLPRSSTIGDQARPQRRCDTVLPIAARQNDPVAAP